MGGKALALGLSDLMNSRIAIRWSDGPARPDRDHAINNFVAASESIA